MAALSLTELSWAAEDLAGAQSRFSWGRGPGAGRGGHAGNILTHSFPTGPLLRITVRTKAHVHLYLLAVFSSVKHTMAVLYFNWYSHSLYLSFISPHTLGHTVSSLAQALIFFLCNIPLWHSLSSPSSSLCQVFCRHPVAANTTGPLFSAPCGSSHMHVLFLCLPFSISFCSSLY